VPPSLRLTDAILTAITVRLAQVPYATRFIAPLPRTFTLKRVFRYAVNFSAHLSRQRWHQRDQSPASWKALALPVQLNPSAPPPSLHRLPFVGSEIKSSGGSSRVSNISSRETPGVKRIPCSAKLAGSEETFQSNLPLENSLPFSFLFFLLFFFLLFFPPLLFPFFFSSQRELPKRHVNAP